MTGSDALTVVEIGPDDWQLFKAVRLAALTDAPEAFGSTLAQWRDVDEDRWRERLTGVPCNLIAMADARPVGQTSVTALDADGCAKVISVWVSGEQRGAGVGDALIAHAVSWAGDHGATCVELEVKRTGRHAIALYKRHGFEVVGDAEAPDEVRMTRPAD